MDKDRRCAFLTLKDIEENSRWANLALADHIKRDAPASPAFVRELVYGVLRNRKLLDYNIARFLKKPGLSVSDRVLLRMGFYQLALMDGVADHAAVNETVALAAAYMKGRQGFINAVLRSIQRDGKRLLDDGAGTRYSCARWIADLWTEQFGAEQAEAFMKASCAPAPLTIRANLAKISRDGLKAKLEDCKAGGRDRFEVRNTELSPRCLKVKGSGLLETELYKKGYFSVQGEASCCSVDILDPGPSDTVIDLCAAPGGKSCAAAELMRFKAQKSGADGDLNAQRSGRVLSFDLYPHRVELILKEAGRLGLLEYAIPEGKTDCIITAGCADSGVFDPQLEGTADCVIADVPCSGLGTLRRNPEMKLAEKSPGEASKTLEELTEIQYNILINALRYVKPSGRVLYSTCTVNERENGLLVRRVLEDMRQGRIMAEKKILPSEDGPDGFYICLIENKGTR